VPVLAIVGEPPTHLQGKGAFQDTSSGGAVDAAKVFQPVSKWCARAARAENVPELLEEAIHAALESPSGPAVLLLPSDVQRSDVRRTDVRTGVRRRRGRVEGAPASAAHLTRVRRAVGLLRRGRVLILAGDAVARSGATEDLADLAALLDAHVAVTPDARDAFDNHAARFVGVAGALGHERVVQALESASVVLLAGTRLPCLAREGLEGAMADKTIVFVGAEPPFVSSRKSLGVGGEMRTTLRALVACLRDAGERPAAGCDAETLRLPVACRQNDLTSRDVIAALERTLPSDAIVLVDAGNTGATAAHRLRAPRRGRWLLATGMAGMGYTFGAAVGAAVASGKRCYVVAGDGAFLMHGLEIHTAVEHRLPITYVILNNNAHGMCLVREQLLLRAHADYNAYQPSHIGAGLAAMFPALRSVDCRDLSEVLRALGQARSFLGPSVVSVELRAVEVPPFAAFRNAIANGAFLPHQGETDESRGQCKAV
jgi:acetolactate synthase I/II/III large subunit